MKIPRYVYVLSAVGTTAGIFVLFKDKTGGERYITDAKIPGRTVIITGATSGMGKETARELAKREARVILACRNLKKCEEVRSKIVEESFNRNIECVKLDLASIQSIREFADAINKNEKHVDILINNAGVLEETRTITRDGFESHMGVNYLGPFLLTNLLLDKLIASAPSRIINLVGLGYNHASLGFTDFNLDSKYSAGDAYKRSKLAMAVFSNELIKRLEGKDVAVYAVLPGVVNTSLRKSGGVVSKPFWLSMFKTPIQGAQTTLYCALEPTLAKQNGFLYTECRKVDVDPIVLHEERSRRLWAISERWTRLVDQ